MMTLRWSLLLPIVLSVDLDYFVDEMADYSNILGGITDPDKGTKYIRYLGTHESTEDCIAACTSQSTADDKCDSFTYITS